MSSIQTNRLAKHAGRLVGLFVISSLWISGKACAFDTNSLKIIHTSPSALRSAGIASQNPENIGALDIPCNEVPNGWGVTISKRLYSLYRRRGFSRAAVCLGLGGRGVYFDPATGKQLPLYNHLGTLETQRHHYGYRIVIAR